MSQQLLVIGTPRIPYLITGVSGHVGFRVLAEALGRGYRVRAVIRNAAQIELIKETESVKPHLDLLEFVVIPDLLARGAFDGFFDSAYGIVHVASPISSGDSQDYKRSLIDPAVNGTVEVIQAAKKVPTIKRIVITSSMGVLFTWDYVVSDDTATIFTARDTWKPTNLEGPFTNAIDAYGHFKAAALAATEQFIQEEKPAFDVVNILPSLVIGRNELNRKAEDAAKGSNGTAMSILLDSKSDYPALGASIHIDDVARLHIDALKPSVPGNRNYICSSGGIKGTNWEDAKDIARRYFSKAVEDGSLPLAGTQPSRHIHLDASETEEVFGWKFASFEEQVKSVAGHYLSLLAAN